MIALRTTLARAVARALALTLLAGCGGPSTTEGSPEGRLLPHSPTALPEMDPESFRALLVELEGKPVVVNVWATWCPPCVDEAPLLAEVSREYSERVQFIGLDILDDRPAARDFITEYGWTYPSIFDPTGRIRDALGYVGQPITVVYDRNGNASFEHVGAIDGSTLRREIEKVL